MRISKLKLNKIKKVLIKLPKVLGEYAFFSFLGLLFLSLIFGGFLFYKYDISAKKEKVDVIVKHLKFKEDVFQRILKEWEEREKGFKEAEFKEYPNPLQKPTREITASTSTEEF
jgi:hypothetical protein